MSCLCRARFRFMQDREYVYARRVWACPSDGGCYALSLPCGHPSAQLHPGSAVHVTDHASGFVVRQVPSQQGRPEGVLLRCLAWLCITCMLHMSAPRTMWRQSW